MGQFYTTPEEAMEVASKSGDVYPSTECEISSTIVVDLGKSKLSKEELIDRIKGAIYGNCIGDAVGLATEFMNKEEASQKYPSKEFHYDQFVRDFHRSRWREGDWTDDSDQMLLILDGIFRHGGKVDEVDFARRLKYWTKHGFPELGDLGGLGIGQTVSSVVSQPTFQTYPHKAAEDVWRRSGQNAAANGAVMRTSILGIPSFQDISTVIENTKKISKTTHVDPRCIASCVSVTTAIALMLQEGVKDIEKIITKALDYGKKEIVWDDKKRLKEALSEFDLYADAAALVTMKLDDSEKIGYTYKCFGAAFWALRQSDFRKAITAITLEAGDADTNGAVAGALLGCKVGYKNLPADWLNGLKFKPWLDKRVDRLLEMLGLSS